MSKAIENYGSCKKTNKKGKKNVQVDITKRAWQEIVDWVRMDQFPREKCILRAPLLPETGQWLHHCSSFHRNWGNPFYPPPHQQFLFPPTHQQLLYPPAHQQFSYPPTHQQFLNPSAYQQIFGSHQLFFFKPFTHDHFLYPPARQLFILSTYTSAFYSIHLHIRFLFYPPSHQHFILSPSHQLFILSTCTSISFLFLYTCTSSVHTLFNLYTWTSAFFLLQKINLFEAKYNTCLVTMRLLSIGCQ